MKISEDGMYKRFDTSGVNTRIVVTNKFFWFRVENYLVGSQFIDAKQILCPFIIGNMLELCYIDPSSFLKQGLIIPVLIQSRQFKCYTVMFPEKDNLH